MPAKSPDSPVVDGVTFPPGTTYFHAQLLLFRYAPKMQVDPYWRPGGASPSPYSGLGRYSHCRILTELLVETFEFHDWSEKALQTFSENEQTAICGGGGSSKSTSAGLYAFLSWLCAVEDTAIVIASTSIDAARRRIWKSIGQFYSHVSRKLGGLEKSTMIGSPRPQIRSSPKDFVHGIYVVPVEQGDVQKAVDQIKGLHATRVLVVGDETDAISQAIVDVCANLRIGTEEFQAIWLGNLPSSLNPLGKLMEPSPGRPVTEAMGSEWTSFKGIKCLRFDGEASPNIRDKGKWTGIVTKNDIENIERQAGGKNTKTYYVMVKGLPPPDGVDDTVMTESLLHKHKAFDPVTWRSLYTTSAMLDPGFGGDMCALRTMKRGPDTDNILRVYLDEIIPIPIMANDPSNPAEYQIAKAVMDFCKARSIPPDEFILDATGIGRGTASVLQREWSPNINVCEFGGSPSDMIVSEEDPRPAHELYDRTVTELWFSIREFIQADMIRNMDEKTALQLCQRKWDYYGKKKSIQKKSDMPSSPNEADALACGIELLRRKGINAIVRTPVKAQAESALASYAKDFDFDGRDDVYASEFA